jgi:hypothetical protein
MSRTTTPADALWRTDFRRDYIVGEELRYIVDLRLSPGTDTLAADEDGWSADVRRELLRWRHSRVVDLGAECWPYDEWLVEPRS